MLKTTEKFSVVFLLCGRWESNPHGFPHTVLSRTPMPIRLRPLEIIHLYKSFRKFPHYKKSAGTDFLLSECLNLCLQVDLLA